MPKLHLTIGLPRSGKSTWAVEKGWPIVNRDAIRFSIGGTIRYFKEETRVSEIERIMVTALFKAGHEDVIIDATHLKQKYIDAWIDFAKDGDKRKFLVIEWKFFTPLDVCVQRAIDSCPDEPNFPAVIRSMWESAETIDIPEFETIVTKGESG